MFERWTESARRTIFFARDEAGLVGSPAIETEHLLLGLFREDAGLLKRAAPKLSADTVHEATPKHSEKIARSLDLPVGPGARRVLAYAAEEAERLGSKEVSPEHLLLGLLREEDSTAAKLLRDAGANLADLRSDLASPSKGTAPFYCPRCAKAISDPLTCGDCSAIICRQCGTPLESASDLGIG
jgi:ATP-dependent Clp protease ATP-binding subunit ClpC